ncbi:MAG: radical SAM proteinB12-binding domain-containing radical SAM protein [Candidatus Methanoliparum thermophilum]|uniref:Radical SAM proteinB12-binding domain-containing radical SAM protein n=1 Tax=Methanoliparum thermophilum TaxID=2491083 RepID=A0A520KSC6_METT2|nr:MAG: radical SAM proteinB12-binding domain-containing radical SAM protein [Candidatus Methanoliparum thermophilum]
MIDMSLILLTSDETLMSNHHGKEFLGFGTSVPHNVIPDPIFKLIFFNRIPTKKGIPIQAPYGLRKIEAKLLDDGFNVLTVAPFRLKNYIHDADVLCISEMDPFGWGPSSSTFSKVLKTGKPFVALYFQKLLESKEVRKAKKRGLKIIVGGPGAWQLKHKPEFLSDHGIDCVVVGEGDIVVSKIIKMAINGGKIPQFYDVQPEEVPSVDEIPEIKNPSINGLIEVGRGCVRRCKFCEVTKRPLRWYPLDKIEREIKANTTKNDRAESIILHAEDVLLYGSKNTIPNREKVTDLMRLAKRYTDSVTWSHASIAAIAADPKLMEECSDIIIDDNQKWWGAEIGLESGSPRIMKKTMAGKAHPFNIDDWPEIVKDGMGIANDNKLIPACTLIVGLPGETDDDVIKTIEMVEDLRDYSCIIVPLFFVPLGQLTKENWFESEMITDIQKELLIICLKHGIKWSREFLDNYFDQKNLSNKIMSVFIKFFINAIERKASKEGLI